MNINLSMSKFFAISRKFLFVFFVTFLFSSSVFAAPKSIEERVAKLLDSDVNISAISRELASISKEFDKGKVSAKETTGYIRSLSLVLDVLSDRKDGIEAELAQSNKRLEAIGEVVEGEQESIKIKGQRKEIHKEISDKRSSIAEIDLLLAKIAEIETRVINIRSNELIDNVLSKQTVLIYPTNLIHGAKGAMLFLYDIVKSPISWYSDLNGSDTVIVNKDIAPMVVFFFVVLVGVCCLHVLIKKKFGYKDNIKNPDYRTRFFAALALSVAYGLVPFTFLGSFIFWIQSTNVLLNSFFGLVINSASISLLIIFLSQTVVRVLFAPSNSSWRLIEVNDHKAKTLGNSLLFSIISIVGVSFFLYVLGNGEYSVEAINLFGMISSAIKSFCIVLVVSCALSEPDVEEQDDEETSFSTKIIILVSVSMLVTFALSLFGYVSLSLFILNRIIATALVILASYVVHKIIKEIIQYLIYLKFWRASLKLRINKNFQKRIEFFLNLILFPTILLCAMFAILGLWGVSIDLLIVNTKRFLSGFYIGGIKISIVSIIFSMFVFFVSLAIFRSIRNSLTVGVLSKSGIDEGVRNSLSSGLGFVGVIVSLLLAIAVAGGSLKSLALIAGALSFGVGLGLQNIVGNCVSGIIILFERPIKVGDWVRVNGEEGIVKQISIRATKIQTFDRADVLIPNGNILSSNVTNLTHGSKQGRVKVAVSVAYGTDIQKMKEILVEIAENNPSILKNPAPSVAFNNFGDSSMDFELRWFVSNILNGAGTKTEVREEIIKKFDEFGIDIPYPHTVIKTIA